MFSLPRDVSRALLNLLPIPTDQSLSNADPSLRRPSLRSELKKKGVSSLRLRRPRSRVSLILNCMTADPSRSTLTSTRMTKSASLRFLLFSAPSTPCQEKWERRLSTLSVFQRDVLQSSMLRELSVERSSRNSSINLLPSRLRWINLSLANLAKFKKMMELNLIECHIIPNLDYLNLN